MTTSEPQAGRRDDDAREHRSIGQRIRDAVLGEEPDDRRDSAPSSRTGDTGYVEPDQGERGYAEPDRDPGTGYTDPTPGRDTGYADPAADYDTGRDAGQAYPSRDREGVDDGRGLTDRDADRGAGGAAAPAGGFDAFGAESAGTGSAAGYAEAPRDAGYADTDRGAYGDTRSGDVDRTDSGTGYAGRDVSGASPDADGDGAGVTRGVGNAPPSGGGAFSADDPGRRVAPDSYDAGRSVADPVDDDVAQDGTPRGAAGYADEPRGSGYADDVRDTGYAAGPRDTGAADATYADDSRGTPASGDGDFVTSSYDPDRDTGYDPHAAGTAATEPVGTADDRRDDLGSADDAGRSYEPAADAGYVDERRADVDRTTGDRDTDYDTGRVDTDRVDTDRVDTGRDAGSDATHRAAGLGAAAAVAAGGAGVAAGVAGSHHQDAEPRHGDDRDTDTRFSGVDDTSTVDATSTGHATSDASFGDTTAPPAPVSVAPAPTAPAPTVASGTPGDAAADQRAEAVADETDESDHGGRERLVPADRAGDYSSRWDALKGDFVDEPRRAVTQADQLVGEVLDDIQRLFTDQRRDLDAGFDHDQASTEDLRLALRRYRSFFDRLLSL